MSKGARDRCTKVLWRDHWRIRCSHPTQAGRVFCHLHTPEAVAHRRAKRQEKWDREAAVRQKLAEEADARRKSLTEELPALRGEASKLRRMVVFLAACCASEYEGTGGDMALPGYWVRAAEDAAVAQMAKKAAEEVACSK